MATQPDTDPAGGGGVVLILNVSRKALRLGISKPPKPGLLIFHQCTLPNQNDINILSFENLSCLIGKLEDNVKHLTPIKP